MRENLKKAQQLAEAEVDPNNVRGHSFHAPKIYDPEFTEYQMSLRDRYPDYYLDPSDEFVYQTTRGKMKQQEGRFIKFEIRNFFFLQILNFTPPTSFWKTFFSVSQATTKSSFTKMGF